MAAPIFFRHFVAVTRGGNGAVVEGILELACQHILVVAEAACGENHGLALDGVLRAVGPFCLDAHGRTVLHQDVGSLGGQHDVDLRLRHEVTQCLRVTRATAFERHHARGAIFGAEAEVLFKLHALRHRPVDALTDVIGVEREGIEVVALMAVVEEVVGHLGRRIVFDAQVLLQLRALCDDGAAADRRGSAQERHFFEEHHFKPAIGCIDGGNHAGTATADDHKIGGKRFTRSGLGLLLREGFHFRIAACLLNAVFDAFQDGVGRERRTAHAAHQCRLACGNLARENLDGVLADADGFLVDADFDFRDLRLAEGYRDRDGPRDTGVRGGVGARRVGECAGRENDGGSNNGILAEVHGSLLGPGFNSRHTESMPIDLRE